MYKIFVTVRNRLSCTTKFITALRKHSVLEHQLYVYDNCTNHKIKEHFMYFSLLYEKGYITQYTVNTKESTFNAFSKAVAFNQFLLNHEQDPNKDKCEFLVCLDNDIIVTPGWDRIIRDAWLDVKKYKMNNVKVIGQLPGGIKSKTVVNEKIAGIKGNKIGKLGGSGFWTMLPTFAKDVGYLDVKNLVGFNKKHDQHYWTKLEKSTNGKDYILGLNYKLCIHVGSIAGSVCNVLTKNKNLKQRNSEELIKFEEAENKLDSMNFDEFYKMIINNKEMINNW